MSGWLETYRGTVFRWEVDNVDHLTVAYYFARLTDAGLRLQEAVGLAADSLRRAGRACVVAACYVRYQRELRMGDIMHVESGVIGAAADSFVMGHRLLNSETGGLCTTVEQCVRHVETAPGTPAPFMPEQRRAIEARRVEWDGPPRERRPPPCGLEGFRDTARDTVKPWEIDVSGQSALSHYIHRFSAANAHAIATFGMTPGYMRDEGRGFSTFEFQLELPGVLHPGDPVTVKSAILHVGNSSLRVFHKMFNERSGELVATLEQMGVHLDTAARRPTALPDALRDRARALLAPTAAP